MPAEGQCCNVAALTQPGMSLFLVPVPAMTLPMQAVVPISIAPSMGNSPILQPLACYVCIGWFH